MIGLFCKRAQQKRIDSTKETYNFRAWSIVHVVSSLNMGWLRLVGSLKWQVSFAKEPYKRDDILRKRRIIWRSLLIAATAYMHSASSAMTATHCNTLQHTATHCNTLQRSAMTAEQTFEKYHAQKSAREHVSCSVLQRVAVCCSVLQCVAVRRHSQIATLVHARPVHTATNNNSQKKARYSISCAVAEWNFCTMPNACGIC